MGAKWKGYIATKGGSVADSTFHIGGSCIFPDQLRLYRQNQFTGNGRQATRAILFLVWVQFVGAETNLFEKKHKPQNIKAGSVNG